VNRELLKLLQRRLRNTLNNVRRHKSSGPLLIAVLVVAVFAVNKVLREPDSPPPPKGTSLSCKIIHVHDGDTVTASCPAGRLQVRVYGIDAPELGQQPWGERSRELLHSLLPSSPVRLEVVDIDRYDRIVARLYNGNQDIGLELVRKGGAVVYSQYNNSRAYPVAQQQAKRDRVGVWSQPGAQQEPWEWRKLNPNY
jgi:micrococcal nuclease